MKSIGWCIFCLFIIAGGFCERTLAVSWNLDVQKNAGYRAEDVDNSISEDVTRVVDYILGSQAGFQGRTFGMKRLQFILMPMMYKMGLMTTLLVVLTVISLKGLTIGIILLILKLSAVFGKFYALLQPQPQPYHSPSWSSPGQPVHLHIHGDGSGIHNNHPYSAYEPSSNSNIENEHYYYKG